MNQQVIELTADMKSVEDEVQNIKTSNIVGTDKTSQDFIASSLRTDVAGETGIESVSDHRLCSC